MAPSSRPKPSRKPFVFLLWTVTHICVSWSDFFSSWRSLTPGGLTLLPLAMLSIEAFMIYKTASAFHLFTNYTRRANAFFYESHKGSFALLVLCVLWTLYQVMLVIMLVAEMMFCDAICESIRALSKVSSTLEQIVSLLFIISILNIAIMTGWLVYSAMRALWRVTGPMKALRGEDMRAGVPLATGEGFADEAELDEWDGWKDNRGA